MIRPWPYKILQKKGHWRNKVVKLWHRDLKNEDNLKNENDLKNEDAPKNDDNSKNEEDP